MKTIISIVALGTLLSTSMGALCDGRVEVDWEERARETSWAWPDKDPSLFDCTMGINEPYQVLLEHIWNKKFLVHITRKDRVRFKFNAHAGTVFDICGDLIVYAEFNPSTSGCTLVAFDLASKKESWRTPLKGIGPMKHSAYSNRVSLDILHGVVHVLGLEAGGKYLSYVSLDTGKVLGYRVFEKGFK